MTTVLSRGTRARRGARRPGWPLLTALLVLAIGASSALVFTNRVELLKLAVILALWAAVAAAFVSVIYRRQSDSDQARARDLKLVYDLQLDREISARREYELTVESQLRRELTSELQSQAADEVAALRAELAALRTNLEILFDADFEHRPALETERGPVRAYSDWGREGEGAGANRVSSSRIETVAPDSDGRTDMNPIIDVPEVPEAADGTAYRAAEPYRSERRRERPEQDPQWQQSPDGAWVRDDAGWPQQPQPRREPPPPPPMPPPAPMPPPIPEPARPEPWPAAQRTPPTPAAAEPNTGWQPVGAEGQWLPAGTPGSNWSSAAPEASGNAFGGAPVFPNSAPPEPTTTGRRGRHAGVAEPAPPQDFPVAPVADPEPATPYRGEGRRARARHATEPEDRGLGAEPPAAPRHRSPESADDDGPVTGGQSVAELLARLQADQGSGGRRRRRRED